MASADAVAGAFTWCLNELVGVLIRFLVYQISFSFVTFDLLIDSHKILETVSCYCDRF